MERNHAYKIKNKVMADDQMSEWSKEIKKYVRDSKSKT